MIHSTPETGYTYYQEFYFLEAEDMARVISINEETVEVPYGSFSENILETMEFTPIEPGTKEYKYYVPGIGMALETNPEAEARVELIDFYNQ